MFLAHAWCMVATGTDGDRPSWGTTSIMVCTGMEQARERGKVGGKVMQVACRVNGAPLSLFHLFCSKPKPGRPHIRLLNTRKLGVVRFEVSPSV